MKKSKSRLTQTIIRRHKAEQKESFKTLADTMNFLDEMIAESRK